MLHAPVPTVGTLPAKVTVPTLAQTLWSVPALAVVTGVGQLSQIIALTTILDAELQAVALLLTVTLYVPAPTVTEAAVLTGGFHE